MTAKTADNTPEVNDEKADLRALRRFAFSYLEKGETAQKNFFNDAESDLAHCLHWNAVTTLEVLVQARAAKQVLLALDAGKATIDSLRGYALQEVFVYTSRVAGFRSTNPLEPYENTATLEFWVEMAKFLGVGKRVTP